MNGIYPDYIYLASLEEKVEVLTYFCRLFTHYSRNK